MFVLESGSSSSGKMDEETMAMEEMKAWDFMEGVRRHPFL